MCFVCLIVIFASEEDSARIENLGPILTLIYYIGFI